MTEYKASTLTPLSTTGRVIVLEVVNSVALFVRLEVEERHFEMAKPSRKGSTKSGMNTRPSK